MVNSEGLSVIDITDKRIINEDITQQVYHKAVTPNLRILFNKTLNTITSQGQVNQLSRSAIAMRGLVSDQFKVANFSKTFAMKTALTSILSKIPKIILGEVQRYGCASDSWMLSTPFNMNLEDKCVYTPNFTKMTFPITVSTTYAVQDEYDYKISIFHKK